MEDTPMTDKWSKDDLPETLQVFQLGNYRTAYFDAQVRDALAKHLNAHHPKPKVGVEINYHWRNPDAIDVIEKLTRERDAAVARAEQAERERDELREQVRNIGEGMVRAQNQRGEMRRERDEVQDRADQLRDERDDAVQSCITVGRARDEWRARAEAAEARTTPAVPLHQPDGTHLDASHLPIDADDDPAVFVVRESDLVYAQRDEDGGWGTTGSPVRYGKHVTVETMHGHVQEEAKRLVRCLSIVHAIQAEHVDPVTEKARELYEVVRAPEWRDWDQLNDADHDEYYRLARHVLGQEATGDE